MSRVQLIIGFLGFAFLAQVAAHGHMSVPTIRDYALRQDQMNAPVAYPLASDFVCRNLTATPSSKWATLVAGSSTPIQWAMEAAHPGDCFAYISYDSSDSIPDSQKKWFKIAQFNQCNMQNLQSMTLNVPSYLPSCDHCILRWEWYALHLQAINIVEFYSQCADVKINGNPSGTLPSPMVTIPGHLPMDAVHYRPGYNYNGVLFTGPPVATVGGASYSCESTYGSSCRVPSPTNNPCTISTQRCMSSSTYQACGIGSTTTVWGPEQACQTGLVCVNDTDGVHIRCTYPSAPSSSSSGAGDCTFGNMRCLSDSSYQTCTNGNSGTMWATAQSCQSGLYCNPNGATIFCGPNKVPISSTPSTPSTPTTPSNPSTTGTSVTAPSTPSTPTPVVSTPSGSSSCRIGDQKCTSSSGATTYQTCTPQRGGSGAWAAPQSCATGQTCHASATANNVYCY